MCNLSDHDAPPLASCIGLLVLKAFVARLHGARGAALGLNARGVKVSWRTFLVGSLALFYRASAVSASL